MLFFVVGFAGGRCEGCGCGFAIDFVVGVRSCLARARGFVLLFGASVSVCSVCGRVCGRCDLEMRLGY